MTDTDLRDQLMTLLLAGHETTATALAWTFDLLLRHPAPLQRLRDSLEEGEEDYLRATITESLRLRPVVPLAGRRLAKELVADGLSCRPAPTSRRRSGSPTPAPTSTPSPSPSGPSASSRRGPTPTPGSPSAAASAAASAPPSPSSRCGSSLREVLTRCELHKAEPGAGADRPPQHHPLAPRRHAGRAHRAPPGARARAARGLARRLLAAARATGCSLAQRAIVPEPEITSPSSRTRIGTSLVPLSSLTSARSSSRLPQVQGISR